MKLCRQLGEVGSPKATFALRATAGRRREGHLIVAHYEVVGRVSKGDRLLRLPQPISVISTISGGQFIRIGRSTMPIP
jgi:hypothetical protein